MGGQPASKAAMIEYALRDSQTFLSSGIFVILVRWFLCMAEKIVQRSSDQLAIDRDRPSVGICSSQSPRLSAHGKSISIVSEPVLVSHLPSDGSPSEPFQEGCAALAALCTVQAGWYMRLRDHLRYE